jgi:hypothetical protein
VCMYVVVHVCGYMDLVILCTCMCTTAFVCTAVQMHGYVKHVNMSTQILSGVCVSMYVYTMCEHLCIHLALI